MNHEEARDLLTDRLLDGLSAEEEERLDLHLASCADCRATARAWGASWEALGALDPAPVDPATHVRFGRRLERDSFRRGATGPRPSLLAAAAVVLLLAGGLAGRALAPGPTTEADQRTVTAEGPRFMLLLRGDEPDRRHPAEKLVAEYGAWAGTLAEAGSLVTAGELEPGVGRWVAPEAETDPASTPVAGFFLVRAPSYDSAAVIARESPHAAYGGVVEVRRVVDGP